MKVSAPASMPTTIDALRALVVGRDDQVERDGADERARPKPMTAPTSFGRTWKRRATTAPTSRANAPTKDQKPAASIPRVQHTAALRIGSHPTGGVRGMGSSTGAPCPRAAPSPYPVPSGGDGRGVRPADRSQRRSTGVPTSTQRGPGPSRSRRSTGPTRPVGAPARGAAARLPGATAVPDAAAVGAGRPRSRPRGGHPAARPGVLGAARRPDPDQAGHRRLPGRRPRAARGHPRRRQDPRGQGPERVDRRVVRPDAGHRRPPAVGPHGGVRLRGGHPPVARAAGPPVQQRGPGRRAEPRDPRTQSALLEAMAERQVTIDGASYPLPDPFFVIATQNPHGDLGTFPLVAGQRDRFAVSLSLGLPGSPGRAAAGVRLRRRADAGDHRTDRRPRLLADAADQVADDLRPSRP